MAAKRLEKGRLKKEQDSKLASGIMDSAQQIWLAGLGAMAVAQREGSKMFETLVEQGEQVESRTREFTETTVEEAVEEVRSQTASATKQASSNWDKLEQIFQDRVSRALGSLGVPSVDDLNGLKEQVVELRKQVDELSSK